ncbi:MAG TPA: MFS transporter, partial [Burkholderiales bacterium]|nr:MFS transporter [Burkholderiales bacterium]
MARSLPMRFLVVFLCGLCAAASIGKLVPHVQWMAQHFGVSLGASGFAVSAVMLPGVLLGPFLGLAADRAGAKRVALAGLALQACASLGLVFAGSFALLIALRLAEGVGYSLAIVAATVLVVEGAPVHRQALALAVWSAFAPLGFALGQWASGGVLRADPLPLIGAGHALVLLLLAAVLFLTVPHGATRSSTSPRLFLDAVKHPPALRTALAFGCATGVLLGAVALAPLVLAPRAGLTVAATAQLTALAALPDILGRFASGWLLGGATRPFAVFVFSGVLGCVFLAASLGMPLPLAAALGCFAAFQIAVGAMPGVMSAMLPRVAPGAGQLGTVSGLANQMITA